MVLTVVALSPSDCIAIIVPTYQEEGSIATCLQSLQGQTPPFEIIVADGGSTDRTQAIAFSQRVSSSAGDTVPIQVLQSPYRARALQMNFGAQQTRANILLFLHADSLLPEKALQAVRQAMLSPQTVGGRFSVDLDRPGWPYNAISWGINVRSRITGMFTGDMGIFVRRSLFEQLGGYPDQPLMEDFELSRQLQKLGSVAYLPNRIVTSSRRWQQDGPWKTVALMQMIRAGYQAGISSEQLARWYRTIR